MSGKTPSELRQLPLSQTPLGKALRSPWMRLSLALLVTAVVVASWPVTDSVVAPLRHGRIATAVQYEPTGRRHAWRNARVRRTATHAGHWALAAALGALVPLGLAVASARTRIRFTHVVAAVFLGVAVYLLVSPASSHGERSSPGHCGRTAGGSPHNGMH
ncbi:MAG: hypothetical protein ACRDQ7_24745 [Haloechinothrix sp.]